MIYRVEIPLVRYGQSLLRPFRRLRPGDVGAVARIGIRLLLDRMHGMFPQPIKLIICSSQLAMGLWTAALPERYCCDCYNRYVDLDNDDLGNKNSTAATMSALESCCYRAKRNWRAWLKWYRR